MPITIQFSQPTPGVFAPDTSVRTGLASEPVTIITSEPASAVHMRAVPYGVTPPVVTGGPTVWVFTPDPTFEGGAYSLQAEATTGELGPRREFGIPHPFTGLISPNWNAGGDPDGNEQNKGPAVVAASTDNAPDAYWPTGNPSGWTRDKQQLEQYINDNAASWGGGGGSGLVADFVWDPVGGAAAPNVFDDVDLLIAALGATRGTKRLVLRDDIEISDGQTFPLDGVFFVGATPFNDLPIIEFTGTALVENNVRYWGAENVEFDNSADAPFLATCDSAMWVRLGGTVLADGEDFFDMNIADSVLVSVTGDASFYSGCNWFVQNAASAAFEMDVDFSFDVADIRPDFASTVNATSRYELRLRVRDESTGNDPLNPDLVTSSGGFGDVRIIRSGARGQRNAGASPVLGPSDVGAIVRVEQNAGVVSFPTASSDRAQPITVVVEDDGISGPLLVELSGSFSVRGNLVSSHYMTAGQSHTFEPNLTGQWELRSAIDPEVTFDRTTPDAAPNLIGDDESLKTFLNYLTSVGFLGARVFLQTPLDILDNPDFPLHNHRFATLTGAFNDISFTGTSTIAAPPAGDFLSVEFEGFLPITSVMAAPALSTGVGVVLNGVGASYETSLLLINQFGGAPVFELAPTGPGGSLFFVNCGVLNMSPGAVSQDPSTSAFPIQVQVSASLSMNIASDSFIPQGAGSAIELGATETVTPFGSVGSLTPALLNTAGVGWSGAAIVRNGLIPSARQADSPVDSYSGPADAGGTVEVSSGDTYELGGAAGATSAFRRPTTVVYNDTAGAPASITTVNDFEVMGATKPRIALTYPGEVAVVRNQWDNVPLIWVGSFGGPPLEVNGRDVTTSVVTAWTNAGAAFYVPWRCDVIGTSSTAHFGSTLASGTVELRIVDLATLTQQGIWPQSINTAPAQIALPGDFQLPAAGWYQMQIRFAAAPANPADTARLDGEVIRFRPDPV